MIKGDKIYLLYGEYGFNTYYISDNFPAVIRTKEVADIKDAKYVIRWGNGVHIDNGPLIINKKKAMTETKNKGQFRAKVSRAGLAPRTWLNVQEFVNYVEDTEDTTPVIVRPQQHSRSENLFFCKDKKDLDKALDKCGPNYYISQFIPKDQEFRVFVANGRAFIVAEKNHKNKKDVSWGCVDEGTLDYINWEDWPLAVVQNAISSFNLSGLDFAAVDIMVKDGQPYFLECNTAPEVWEYYGKSFAKVFKYMTSSDTGRDRLPIKNDKKLSWKNYIHPAMTEHAIV